MFQIVSGEKRGEKRGVRARKKGGKWQNEYEKLANQHFFKR